MRGFATIDVNASPEAVWSLISDVTQIGRFSPETFEAQWLDGAVGPAVGAKFRGHVKRNEKGPIYWTACTVTECDPGRVFAFADELYISGLTVKTHIGRIFTKLGLRDRAAAIVFAYQHRVIAPS